MEILKNYSPNPKSQNIRNYSLIIEKGDSLRVISSKMVEKEIIKHEEIFEFFARFYNYDQSIKTGQYKITNNLSIKNLLDHLNLGKVVQNRITITEGMNNATFYEILKNNKLLSGTLDFIDFPTEGYLAPDTYFYEKGEKRINLLNRIMNAQSKKINDIWVKRPENNLLKNSHELVILASIIEKETGNYNELDLVSSVLHNRLRKKMRLQADPTVIYGITKGKKSLDRPLTKSDLKKYSEYNTYIIKGLPPNPICNPGENALKAAANPANSRFYYYVSNGIGGHFFSKNLAEHNKNVKLYKSLVGKNN